MNKLLVGGVCLVFFMVIVVPGIIAVSINQFSEKKEASVMNLESVMINVYLHEQDKLAAMPLEEYIKGVVGAEMPAEFEIEALKAQAVAARTYAVKHMRSFGGDGVEGHPDADVSTDFTKSQAWLDDETLKSRWGKNANRYLTKIITAVNETRGQIAVYEDQPINAVFHSTSGDRTASAKEVWGTDFPYLQSVECKWDKASPRYQEEKEFSFAALGNLLGNDAEVVSAMQGGNADVARVISHTDSGRVKEVKIGARVFSGEEARSLLGLRSENFSINVGEEKVFFKTVGYGHGVGLCQYGAGGMAKERKTYQEILQHYYQGISFKNIYAS